MVERARRSVGATIAAADAALTDGCAANLAGGTHHAFADRGEGLLRLQRRRGRDPSLQQTRAHPARRSHRLRRPSGQWHRGDLRRRSRRVHLSLHGAKNYPFKKELSDLDVELDDGTTDEPYLERWHIALDMVFAHAPEVIFYLAGADPYEGDRLGRLKLTIDGLDGATSSSSAAAATAGLPVIVTMSGGYAPDVDAIVTHPRQHDSRRRIVHAGCSAGTIRSTLSTRHPKHPTHQHPRHPGTRHLRHPMLCNASASSPKTTSSRCCRWPTLIAGDGGGRRALLGGRGAAAGAHGADGRTDARLLRPDAGIHRTAGAARREAGDRVQRQPQARAAVASRHHRAARSRHRGAHRADGRPLHHRSAHGRGVGRLGAAPVATRRQRRWRSSAAACRRAAISRRYAEVRALETVRVWSPREQSRDALRRAT